MKPVDINDMIGRERLAEEISDKWHQWDQARATWKEEKKELRNYIFATDTRKTTNAKLPWKNSTTLPKICQIRDNLHANYMAALFPQDKWFKWEGGDIDSVTKNKVEAIENYVLTKTKDSNLRTTVSQLVYDFIDYGNAIAGVMYENNYKEDPETGEFIPGYIGPRVFRISPFDHVFDPTVDNYVDAPKITRTIKTLGQLASDADSKPELQYSSEVIEKVTKARIDVRNMGQEDMPKDEAFRVDGFGSLYDYFASDYVEILEFEGDVFDVEKGELQKDRIITVVDRSFVIRNIANPSWFGRSNKKHVGWRTRPDNLWAMGPLDNLVGMQYRIDHVENAKADAIDQYIHPKVKVRGYVEPFSDEPGERIFLGDEGDVIFERPDLSFLQYDQELIFYSNIMEEMAGAPKQAMGFRTPGEKTAYEVQSLENASSRIFQNKVSYFEEVFLEPLLNEFLEQAKRNLNTTDVARVMDDDFGVQNFVKITKEDITAKGKLRPIGARHFAAQNKMVQELTQFASSSLAQDPAVNVHISGKKVAKLLENRLGLEKFELVQDNIRIVEQMETQKLANTAQNEVEEDAITPIDEEPMPEDPSGGLPPEMM